METDGSLPCTQQPITGLSPQPDKIQFRFSHPVTLRHLLIFTTHLHLDLSGGRFPVFKSKIMCKHFSEYTCLIRNVVPVTLVPEQPHIQIRVF